mmetsp:Transcript_11881/g.14748  ORF Transcript_11881/g.14748 Transcript_11881/m.14748 type:complete len:256 (-) Transcript_11881:415-1182(-)
MMIDHSDGPSRSLQQCSNSLQQRAEDGNNGLGCFHLIYLPSEVLILMLSCLGIQECESSVKLVSKAFRALCDSQSLWREHCQQTGKLNSQQFICHNFDYKRLYYTTPCVPIDFTSIDEALKQYPNVCHKSTNSSFTITLMPGVYQERIQIKHTEMRKRGQMDHYNIQICAAFPEIGAAIIHYNEENMNLPCISLQQSRSGERVSLTLKHLHVLHFTKGNDIWSGNCALQVDGVNMTAIMTACSFQSDSGRGVGKF